MYTPKHHEEHDLPTLHALMRAHPLGTWVTQEPGGLVANHIPFMVDASRGQWGTLRAHVARSNPVWRSVAAMPSLVIFQGADAYISPSWYPSKHADGKAVPTWNYATVHVQGHPRVLDDKDAVLQLVSDLTALHESSQAVPWQVSDAPSDYIDKLLGAIVGIEIPIAAIEGKWKVNQNHPRANQLGLVAGLTARNRPHDAEMAAMVQRHIKS